MVLFENAFENKRKSLSQNWPMLKEDKTQLHSIRVQLRLNLIANPILNRECVSILVEYLVVIRRIFAKWSGNFKSVKSKIKKENFNLFPN